MITFRRIGMGAALLLLLLTVWTASAQESPPALEPDSVQLVFADAAAPVSKGQTFVVNVVSRMETPVYGFGFQVQFDPTQLKPFPRPGQDGAALPLVIGDLFGQVPQRVKNAVETAPDPALNQVDVVYTLLPPANPMRGSGVIGSIAFTVIGDGQSEIRLVNPRLIQVNGGQAQDVAVKIGTYVLALDPSSGTSGAAIVQPGAASQTAAPRTDLRLLIVLVLVGGAVVFMVGMGIVVRRMGRAG